MFNKQSEHNGKRLKVVMVIALILILTGFNSDGFSAHIVPGTIDGTFEVNNSGEAIYTIPIEVPPGTAGMQPKLSLIYESGGQNGLLGVGWRLAGLSTITRCPATIRQDGFKGAVNFDSYDRFCLNGQRLISIKGIYGADGTEYRTDRESWTRVISHGQCGNGPCNFTTTAKNGSQMEFGNTADSRIEAQGRTDRTVRVWAVNEMTDNNGNYVTAYLLPTSPQERENVVN